GPQPHVDAIQKSLGRGVAQRLDKLLPEFPISRCIALGEKDEVDVARIIQLFAAQLAKCQHAKSVERYLVSLPEDRQAGLHKTVGEQRQLQRDVLEVEQAEAVARTDAQQFPLLIPSQRVELRGQITGSCGSPAGLEKELLAIFELGEP